MNVQVYAFRVGFTVIYQLVRALSRLRVQRFRVWDMGSGLGYWLRV